MQRGVTVRDGNFNTQKPFYQSTLGSQPMSLNSLNETAMSGMGGGAQMSLMTTTESMI